MMTLADGEESEDLKITRISSPSNCECSDGGMGPYNVL